MKPVDPSEDPASWYESVFSAALLEGLYKLGPAATELVGLNVLSQWRQPPGGKPATWPGPSERSDPATRYTGARLAEFQLENPDASQALVDLLVAACREAEESTRVRFKNQPLYFRKHLHRIHQKNALAEALQRGVAPTGALKRIGISRTTAWRIGKEPNSK